MYPYENNIAYTNGIAQDRLNEAASYTAGMLMAVSRSLPPIVADASLSAPRLTPGGSVQLSFDILENRTTDAYLVIELKDETGGSQAIISPEYQTGKAEALEQDFDPARLPYKKHIELDWDGTLANGEWAPSGERRLVVTARDGDGNESAPLELDIIIDAGGPFVALRSNIGGCGYHDFQGISSMNPACTNVSMAGYVFNLSVRDPSGGIKKIELLKGETAVYARSFAEPPAEYIEELPALEDGQYKLVAEDADGNLTEAPFRLGSVYLASDMEAAYSVYNPATGMMSVTLTVDASGYYDLTGVEAIDELGQVAESRALTGKSGRETFELKDILSLEEDWAHAERLLRLKDVSGQALTQGESFAVYSPPYIPTTGSDLLKYSAVTDLLSLGLLPGAVTGRNWFPIAQTETMLLSGAITTSQPVGTIEVHMQTGDSSAALGAEQLASRRRIYDRFFEAGALIPDNCGEPGVHTVDKTVTCLYDTFYTIPSSRYAKFRVEGTPAQPIAVLRDNCRSVDPNNSSYCDYGVAPVLSSLGDQGLSYMLRGVGHGESMASLVVAGEAALEAGQNVTMRINDLVAATFDNVTKAGFISTGLVMPRDYPGMTPLTSFGVSFFQGEYSGNVRFTAKYSGSLTPAREAGIGVLQSVRDPETGLLSYTRLASTLDTAKNEVSFVTDKLTDFVVAAPVYETPSALESAELVDGSPELGFVSDSPLVTSRMLSPGSPEEEAALEAAEERGLSPAGNIYNLGPEGAVFSPAAAVRMRYSDALVAARGLLENTLALYQFTSDSKLMTKLPNQWFDSARNELVASVPVFNSNFAVMGSRRDDPEPQAEDITPPLTSAVTEIPPHTEGDSVFISTRSRIFLDAWDPEVEGRLTSGLKETYYLLYRPGTIPGTEPTLYQEPFNLEEGTHFLDYRSADNQGNLGLLRSATFYADGTAPVSTAAVVGEGVLEAGVFYITEASSLSVTAVDPAGAGFSSGVGAIYVAISTSPCLEFSEYTSGPGVCRRMVYAGPFSLPAGEYYFYHAAMDNTGNWGEVAGTRVEVRAGIVLTGTAVSTAAIAWNWTPVPGAESYELISSSSGSVSGPLAGDTTSWLQTGLTPNTLYGNSLKVVSTDGEFTTSVSSAVTLANPPGAIEVFDFGQNASLVIGQPDFSSKACATAANRLCSPTGLAIDAGKALWVADKYNYRVLRFSPPFFSGMSADLVIGQENMDSSYSSWLAMDKKLAEPSDVTLDTEGNVWVSDTLHHRILRFSPPFSNTMSANLAIGQENLFEHITGLAADKVAGLRHGMRFDKNGALWLTDMNRHRVLRFTPPFSSGMDADLVIGQMNFVSSDYASPPTRYGFRFPRDLGFDSSGRLFVSDILNDRVLVFEPPFSNGMGASTVIGQKEFTLNNTLAGTYSPAQDTLYRPNGVTLDGFDNLFVNDAGNNRILKFRPPHSTGMDASLVLGQYDFTSGFNFNPQSALSSGEDTDTSGFLATDSEGQLWVADTGNSRVLMFEPVRSGLFADIGADSFTVRWLPADNPDGTRYAVEASISEDFSAGIVEGTAGSAEYRFSGLAPNTKYYIRAKAVNMAGAETAYTRLNFVYTRPAPAAGFSGVADSESAILWSWQAEPGLGFQVFSSTGGPVSGILAEGTTWFLQTGLEPNKAYLNYVRSYNRSGSADSGAFSETTRSAVPRLINPFVSGQSADMVIGQQNFVMNASGLSQNTLYSPNAVDFDPDGNLWVADTSNCRVLRFPPPFSAGMSADLVIGQGSFGAKNCTAGAAQLKNPAGITFDGDGSLWVADASANRVLRFSPPFVNGKEADLVIGQNDFVSVLSASGVDRLAYPFSVMSDPTGNLWVADYNNSRVLRYSPPFGSGMSANLVLGQKDFYSNSAQFSMPDMTPSPYDIGMDKEGSIWVADSNSRVVRFRPPFVNGMSADLAIGQPDPATRIIYDSPSEYNLIISKGLAFDFAGNLYVSNSWYNRVMQFTPSFMNGMSASSVIGQADFYSRSAAVSQAGLSYPMGLKSRLAEGRSELWVADRYNNRVLGFYAVKSVFSGISQNSANVSWEAGNNPQGTEYKAELSELPDFSGIVLGDAWTVATEASFNGLVGGSTYYARVRSRNLSGLESGYLQLGSFVTAPRVQVTAESTTTVNGMPEIAFSAFVEPSIVYLSTISPAGTVALGAAADEGLTLASNLYEIGPEGDYDPPAGLAFVYSTAALTALGLLEEDIAVYEYFSGTGWVRLEGQVLDAAGKTITVPITQIASLFGIFGVVKDRVPPVTSFAVDGSSWSAEGRLYINTVSSAALSAYDPVVNGTSSGVAFTEFRLDPGADTGFTRYDGAFLLPEGEHLLEFRSVDNTGNIETASSLPLFVDGAAPAVHHRLTGPIFSAGAISYAAPGSTLTIIASDDGAGVGMLYYVVNGTTFFSVSGSAEVVFSSGGAYDVEYYAVDNLGNGGDRTSVALHIDDAAPFTGALLAGATGQNGWHVSPVAATLLSTDSLSGVATVYYSLDGAEASVYASSFTVTAEGAHSLAFKAVDNVGNIEPEKTEPFRMDLSVPEVLAVGSPAPNAAGWNNAPVTVTFSGSDPVSGIAYCSSSFTVTVEGRDIPVSGYCADYAGWTSTAALALNIDVTPPGISISSPAAGQVFIATRGKIDISFAVADNFDPSPVFGAFLVQTEDRGSPRGERPTVIAVSTGQAIEPLDIDDGLWRLTASATDFADNASYLEGAVFEVIHDINPPQTTFSAAPSFVIDGLLHISAASVMSLNSLDDLALPGDGAGLGVKTQVFKVTDGEVVLKEIVSENLHPAAGAVFISTFTGADWGLADGSYYLDYRAEDILGGLESVRRSSVALDSTPPAGDLAVSGERYDAGTVYVSTRTEIVLSGADPEVNGISSGLEGIYYVINSSSMLRYSGPFNLAEGGSLLEFYARDNAGNSGLVISTAIYSDGTPPRVELLFDTTYYASDGGTLYANGNEALFLTAVDPIVGGDASGVREIVYSLNGTSAVYVSSFTLPGGPVEIVYYAVDNVDNSGAAGNFSACADKTAPVSAWSVAGYQSLSGGTLYLAPESSLSLSAADQEEGGCASGLAYAAYALYADGGAVPLSSGAYGPVPLPSLGVYELVYSAMDNVHNTELERRLRISLAPPAAMRLDLSPDTLNLNSGGKYVTALLEAVGDYSSGDMDPASLLITRVNGVAITPLAPDLTPAGKSGKYKHVSLMDSDGNGIEDLSVKFDRQLLQAALDMDEQALITLEGSFSDGARFTAEDYIRVISPGKALGKAGGRVQHASGAAAALPEGALSEASAITVVRLGAEPRAAAEARAAKAGERSLKGSAYEFGPHGSVFARPVTLSLPCSDCGGLDPVIAYWNEESAVWETLASRLDGDFVKAETTHFSLYQVMVAAPAESPASSPPDLVLPSAGPDAAFRLGEVYIFPNPALRGAAPTFHIECGIADSVNIKIYTTSGRLAHETTLTGMPSALDDGNGLSYAYEYAWRDHIPSGVYYYLIEAARSGQKLKKTGKFAVVR